MKEFGYLILISVCVMICAFMGYDSFFAYSLSRLDLEGISLMQSSMSGQFSEMIMFSLVLGIVPFIIYFVKRMAGMETLRQGLLGGAIILFFGLLSWEIRLQLLNAQFSSLRSTVHHLDTAFDIGDLRFGTFLLIGFLLGGLVAAFIFLQTKKRRRLVNTEISSDNISKDRLISIEFEEKDFAQSEDVDTLLNHLIQKYFPDYDEDSFLFLDTVARNFVLILDMDGQVQNGGLVQFIDNGSGNYFHETIEAARDIKNDKLIEILTKILEHFPEARVPKDWDERRVLWDQLCDKQEDDENCSELWDALDKEYYNNAKQMNEDLITYLKQNAKMKA
jgi:hypothetical protein